VIFTPAEVNSGLDHVGFEVPTLAVVLLGHMMCRMEAVMANGRRIRGFVNK
jgi:hypothetical protein